MARSRKSNKAKVTGENSADAQKTPKESLSSEGDNGLTSKDTIAETAATPETDTAKTTPAEEPAAETPETAPTSGADADEKSADGTETSDIAEAEAESSDASAHADSETPDEAETKPTDASDGVAKDAETPDTDPDVDGEAKASDTDAAEAETTGETAKDEVLDPVELEETPEPEPKPEPEVVRGSMWPAVFGGVIAAGIGFIAGRGEMLDGFFPGSAQQEIVDIAAVEERLVAQLAESTAMIEVQSARIDGLEATSVTDVLDTVAALQGDIETLTSQVAALEGQPAVAAEPGVDPEAVDALQSALEAQEAQLTALAERAAAAEANAETEAARILASAALLSVVTAMDSGAPFADALSELEAVTPVDVPAPLADAAEAGVPTLADLQDAFPEAARAALAAARSDVPEGESATLGAFLQRQLNVRSVVPRDGDDADAVLSRAQAAVRDGDLTLALSEVDALPEAALAEMADWVEAATARQAAKDAANALADSLSSN